MNKKIKTLIILIILLSVIAIALYILYSYKKLQNDRFSVRNGEENLVDITEIPFNYSLLDAFKDGYVIIATNGTITNEKYLNEFYSKYQVGQDAKVRVAIDKDTHMEFVDLAFENGTITIIKDNTRDKNTVFQTSISKTNYDVEKYFIDYDMAYNKVLYSIQNKDKLNNKRDILFTYLYHDDTNTDFIFEFESDDTLDKEIIAEFTNPYSFMMYNFKGHAYVNIDGERISIKDALDNDQITIDDILMKLYSDSKDGTCACIKYKDNGTYLYQYEDLWIIKGNTDDGFQDLYIGPENMYYSNGSVTIVND